MQGSANNQLLTLSSITGRDNAKGQVTGSGSLKLASLLTPEIDISLKLHKFIFAQNDEITGRGSGTLNFKGVLGSEDAKRAAITGDIIIKPIEIRLEDHTEKMVTIQLLEKKKDGTYQTSKEKQKQVEKERSTVQIPLNIKLTSPEDIFVRGYGFDARWKGDMYAKGTLFDPYLVGDITLVRGKFDLLGKPLKLTEGKISYTEHPKNDPMMAILGSREVGEITAMMRIEGHASKPSITFSSSPALPQEEVLARILFGRGIESISVTQSLMLASALSTFKGKNNLNFTDKIRTAFGLDVLEFKEKKSADDDSFQSSSQQVSVGKQLTDKIYLSLDQSVSGDSGTSATVQLDVTPSLKLEADVGGNTNTGVGFSWVKKY
jgi:translocation and assembly module TamB